MAVDLRKKKQEGSHRAPPNLIVQAQNIWADSEGQDFVSAGTSLARQNFAKISSLTSHDYIQKKKNLYLHVLKTTSTAPLALPLQHSEIIAADPELKQTWESVSFWCDRFMRSDDERKKNQELRRVSSHIQLACKFLSIRLKEFIQGQAENSPAKTSALKTLRQVHVVANG